MKIKIFKLIKLECEERKIIILTYLLPLTIDNLLWRKQKGKTENEGKWHLLCSKRKCDVLL